MDHDRSGPKLLRSRARVRDRRRAAHARRLRRVDVELVRVHHANAAVLPFRFGVHARPPLPTRRGKFACRPRVKRSMCRLPLQGGIMASPTQPAANPGIADLASRIYVELVGRAFLRAVNTAVIKPDPIVLAKLSLQFAED